MVWSKLLRDKSNSTFVQAFRFGVVGLVAFAVDFSCLLGAVEFLGLNYLVSAAVGYSVGLCVNYLLCVRWVFPCRRFADRRTEFILFFLVGLTGLMLTEIVLWIGTEIFELDFRVSKIAALFVCALWNFVLRKIVLFSNVVFVRTSTS